MYDVQQELSNKGLSPETYEGILEECSDKVQGITSLDWQDIVDKYDLGIHYDSLRKSQQCAPFGGAFVRDYFMQKLGSLSKDERGYIDKLKTAKNELAREKVKIRDERNELARLQREAARQESFIELVKREIATSVEPIDYIPVQKCDGDSTAIVMLSDIHTGAETHNFLNDYSIETLIERLKNYLDELRIIQSEHPCSEAILFLGGDLISGLIHVNLRIQNNENVVKQLKRISTYITNFTEELVKIFGKVRVYGVSGNHSRVSPNKEDHLKGEELDSLVLFYLGITFKNAENVNVYEDNIDDTICTFQTQGGYLFAGVHGDKDTPANAVQNLTMMLGTKPDAVLIGHRHHNGMDSAHGSKLVQVGSVMGNDDFCIDHRISGIPEQCVIISTARQAVRCVYNIDLR